MDASQKSLPANIANGLHKVCDPTKSVYIYRNIYHSHVNFNCIDKMLCDGLLCDVILVADEMEIEAHKVILAACSAFFYYKFSSVRKLGLVNRIQVDDINYQTLSAVITFFYKSEVLITEENVEDLLGAAYNLAVPDLQKACWGFIEINLSSRNCLRIRIIAEKYRNDKLVPIVDAFIEEHFSEVIKNGSYKPLTYKQIFNIIRCDRLCVTEDELLECIIQWIRFDIQQRKDYVYSLMRNVRLSLISQHFMLQIMEEETWLKSEPQFLLQLIYSPIQKPLLIPGITRKLSSKLLVVVGLSLNHYLSLEMYDFETKLWSDGPEILKTRCDSESRIVINETKVYCMEDNIVKFIDLSSNTAEMVWSKCNHIWANSGDYNIIASFDNTIYKVGGSKGRKYLAMAEKYNFHLGRWERIADMSIARDSVGLVEFDKKLYAIGGRTVDTSHSNLGEFFDKKTDSWHTMPAMSVGRYDPGVGVLGDNIFVVGGHIKDEESRHVESFNTVDNTWARLPDMNIARDAPGVLSVNGQLCIIGGCYENNSLEIYDQESKTWSVLPSFMKTNKKFVTAALIDKSLIKF